MERKLIVTGLLFVILSIVLGAFAAHGLSKVVENEDQINSFDTGVRYLFISGIGFLVMAALREKFDFLLKTEYFLIFWGTIIFSGSIFILVIAPHFEWSISKMLGPITPIGGLAMILGWVILLLKYIRTTLEN
ncbi:MAG: DUF423 domain-containing protein [Crocinitomicaceae bacterium]|nr:DUF423 domain-containing protein [Crocinitomicaceae bacterium]